VVGKEKVTSNTVYEFPLNEKVRIYLRLEQLFKQLDYAQNCSEDWQFISFFDCFFTLLDLLERLDIRTDILKDIETHNKNLQHWSKHPKIDQVALQQAIQKIVELKEKLRSSSKVGSGLKDDKFLSSIRQRFSIPGATCSFDLPNLHFWLKQPQEKVTSDISRWLNEFTLIHQAIDITLSFLRERGRFENITATNGFYQGVADERNELIRIYCASNQNYYPTLSGNKYRYAIRFMFFAPDASGKVARDKHTEFKLASC